MFHPLLISQAMWQEGRRYQPVRDPLGVQDDTLLFCDTQWCAGFRRCSEISFLAGIKLMLSSGPTRGLPEFNDPHHKPCKVCPWWPLPPASLVVVPIQKESWGQ